MKWRVLRYGGGAGTCTGHQITDWVHVTRPAAATTTGHERYNLGKVVDTPSLTCR